MGEEDIAEVAALLRRVEAETGHPALGEHQWLDLVHGGRAGFAGFVARRPGRARLLGYAQVSRGIESFAIEVAVEARHKDEGVDVDLLRAAINEVAAQGGGHVHLWVARPSERDEQSARAVGLSPGRELYQLRRALPLEDELVAEVPKLALRPFRVGVDEPAWLELNNRVFGGHPEQGCWDRSTIEQREQQEWFDPDGFLLYERHGRLVGFCWTKIAEADDAAGELYVLGVDPDARGSRIGAALLAAGCAHLSARACRIAMLYVDSDNARALRLYRSFGFAVDHADRAYVADVKATVGP